MNDNFSSLGYVPNWIFHNNNNDNNTIYLKLAKKIARADKGQLYPIYNI